LTPRSSALLPVRITTARRPDHIRLSALVRSRSTQSIVHASSQLGLPAHGPPKRGHFFCHFGGLLLTTVMAAHHSIQVWNALQLDPLLRLVMNATRLSPEKESGLSPYGDEKTGGMLVT